MAEAIVYPGDTFELVAIKQYGSAEYADRIAMANPGVFPPFAPGTVLRVPQLAEFRQSIESDKVESDKVVLVMYGKRVINWTGIEINMGLDQVSGAVVSGPFDSNDKNHRLIFQPFSFAPVTVDFGERLFTGTLVNPLPQLGEKATTVSASCYAYCGVLQDCTAPDSAKPLEWFRADLITIAKQLCKPFGVAVVNESGEKPIIEQTAMNIGEPVFSFLSGHAQRNNLIIGSNENGDLVFRKPSASGKPDIVLEEGKSPLISVSANFDGQKYYSDITGVSAAIAGISFPPVTVRNAKLPGVVRPFTFQVDDQSPGDLEEAVNAKIGRMFGNMASFTVQLATIRRRDGKIFRPGDMVRLTAPGAMIYEPFVFMVRNVTLSLTPKSETAVLTLVLPGSFSGEIPDRLPWET